MKYKNDPRWITAKFNCKCERCGKEIKKGDECFYYPIGRSVYCENSDCGQQESRQFESAAFDESMLTGKW